MTAIDEGTKRGLKKWVWAGVVYNVLISVGQLLPEVFEESYKFTNSLNDALGLGGEEAIAPDEAINRLFVNFSSLLLLFLALLLVYASKDLEHRLGIVFLNAAARIASIALFLYYLLVDDAPRILFLFVVCDLVLTVAFLAYINRIRGLAPRTWLD